MTAIAPSGAEVHRIDGQLEGKFSLMAQESGRYRFCLEANAARRSSRYAPMLSVIWDLQMGHIQLEGDHAGEEDANKLWKHGEQL
jgi:hypothetical protein